jgi:hypothetical protein
MVAPKAYIKAQTRHSVIGQLFQNAVAVECVEDDRFGDFEHEQAQASLNRGEKLRWRGWQTLTEGKRLGVWVLMR